MHVRGRQADVDRTKTQVQRLHHIVQLPPVPADQHQVGAAFEQLPDDGKLAAPHGGNADFHPAHAQRTQSREDGDLGITTECNAWGLLSVPKRRVLIYNIVAHQPLLPSIRLAIFRTMDRLLLRNTLMIRVTL